ncbi:substrate-binding domain-containing protein [Paenibacillus roseipurpureus]|uniref:Substrate-binding domain-containing protein n=1 Tax=Paenibacillus roseopurpureus TaxID=2918901 RepID=A0AA96RIQ1_9BACL|nr:substrate-binding domain-containing protein [Paenibacillus sp. MBLB1832]WNR42336.1 substrate-binding domain-containing protein [Paenibacillus sp. MBLB1832]
MKKLMVIAILVCSCITLSFSLYYVGVIFQSDLSLSSEARPMYNEHAERIVIISQEQGSFMMNEVQKGARKAAELHQLKIDFWGVYRSNLEGLIKQIDIAIASKASGIIVEGVDHPDFDAIVKKATEKGIPVITINSDAPNSLRKSYIGSDHYQEGIIMGQYIATQLKGHGVVGVIQNLVSPTTDDLRLKGLREVLSKFDGIQVVLASNDIEMSQPKGQTNDILNHNPAVNAFIGLSTDSGESIVQAARARAGKKEYPIYLFDDSPQTVMLIKNGQVKSGLSQHYEEMGVMSVNLMKRWLDATQLPLENSYFTPISVVTSPEVEVSAP